MKRLLGTAAAAGLVLLASATGVSAAEDDAEPMSTELQQVAAYTQPSIVSIITVYEAGVYDATAQAYIRPEEAWVTGGSCTGYAVNPEGIIATAGHCVDPQQVLQRIAVEAATWAGENGFYGGSYYTAEDILSTQEFHVENYTGGDLEPSYIEVSWPADATGAEVGRTERAEVVDFESLEDGDAAVLRVKADDLIPLPLSDGEDVEQGIDVVAIGYPGSVDQVTTPTLNPSYKDGSLSSIKTSTGGFDDVYEISAAVSGGMSGGPVVNTDSEVIGFNSYGNVDETQAFNFSGPSTQILDMLQANNLTNELGPTAEAYRAGLDALYDGDRATAIAELETVLEADPENAFAQQYLEEAQALTGTTSEAAESDDSGGFPILWVAIGAGGLVVLGLVLFLVLRKSGGSSSSARPSHGPAVPGAAAWPPLAQPVQPPYQQQAYPAAPAQQAYPAAPAPQMPVPPPAAPPAAAPSPAFDPNKTTYVGQQPHIPQQQQQPPQQ
jgi:serine protease Do